MSWYSTDGAIKSPFSTPLSFEAQNPANPCKSLHKFYTARNYDLWPTFLPLIVWVYVHSYFRGGLRFSEKHMCHVKNASWPLKVSSRSSKVIDLGTNRKCVLGFLLVFNSNLGRILHRFGDMAPYRSKNRKKSSVLTHPTLTNRPR